VIIIKLLQDVMVCSGFVAMPVSCVARCGGQRHLSIYLDYNNCETDYDQTAEQPRPSDVVIYSPPRQITFLVTNNPVLLIISHQHNRKSIQNISKKEYQNECIQQQISLHKTPAADPSRDLFSETGCKSITCARRAGQAR
jgi:hypothetical protein